MWTRWRLSECMEVIDVFLINPTKKGHVLCVYNGDWPWRVSNHGGFKANAYGHGALHPRLRCTPVTSRRARRASNMGVLVRPSIACRAEIASALPVRRRRDEKESGTAAARHLMAAPRCDHPVKQSGIHDPQVTLAALVTSESIDNRLFFLVCRSRARILH